MSKKTIDAIDVRGKRVLVRLDLNVPLDEQGDITDDRRIREALPTVKKLLGDGGRLVLMSHLGRPAGDPAKDANYSLRPVAKRLGELLNQDVTLIADYSSPAEPRPSGSGLNAADYVDALPSGRCCLLENLRFHSAETIKDKDAAKDPALRERKDRFAAAIAALGDIYVNDAFGTCHRDNASMLTVPQLMNGKPRVIGYLIAKELRFLGQAVADPKRPFVVILGGAKVSDKVGAIEALLEKCDTLLIGGAMAYTFAAADGHSIGKSLVEPDRFDIARALRQIAGDKLRLPVDSIVAAALTEPRPSGSGLRDAVVCSGPIPADLMGLDIGPATVDAYEKVLATAATIVWNGPMGVFETPPFDTGTLAIARAVASATARGAVTIVGGGDSAAAIDAAGLADQITHVSTGGGASLEFLEGKAFKPLEILDDL